MRKNKRIRGTEVSLDADTKSALDKWKKDYGVMTNATAIKQLVKERLMIKGYLK